ncbi:MAG: hypothetical protein BM558_12015 [Roseobacter sp. MedPE-SW]|nr:MAG: hypothetical protein BM558_12015 [Roseobacter sp. MedPE-SW]
MSVTELRANIDHWQERVDMAASFRWVERLNMHEGVANHFSLAVNEEGSQFLMNANMMHFARVTASNLLFLDANDPETMTKPGAPDPTAWGLHGSIHRLCPQARCVMHVHSIFATVLASLADSNLPPIDQNCATFFNRYVIDDGYGGLAFEDEGARCAAMLTDPKQKVMIMGNHGVLVIGSDPADTLNRLYYFERAAETYIRALQTGQKLRVLSDEIAEKTAQELDDYPSQAEAHLREIKLILDSEGSNYAS